jgi:hypothetical protein
MGGTFSGCVKVSRTPRQKHIKEREIPAQLPGVAEIIILKWTLKIMMEGFSPVFYCSGHIPVVR